MACFRQDRAPSHPGEWKHQRLPPPPGRNEVLGKVVIACWGCPMCAPSVMGSVRLATVWLPKIVLSALWGPSTLHLFPAKTQFQICLRAHGGRRRREEGEEEKPQRERDLEGGHYSPEGREGCPQSRMRETVMSPLEMGEQWGQVLLICPACCRL